MPSKYKIRKDAYRLAIEIQKTRTVDAEEKLVEHIEAHLTEAAEADREPASMTANIRTSLDYAKASYGNAGRWDAESYAKGGIAPIPYDGWKPGQVVV